MNPNPTILVGCNQKVVCIRVQGKGSFQNSTGIKKFANAMIDRGHRNFVVDLADCPVMDSTFMGTLTGVALRLHGIGQGDLHVINSNERNTNLLEGLGLDQILSLEGSNSPVCNECDSLRPDANDALPPDDEFKDKRTVTKTMRAAHEALVEADPQNFSKFKDVLEYLKNDLRSDQSID